MTAAVAETPASTTSLAPAPPRAGRREWIGLGVLALACLLYVMDLTVLHLAVPSISEDLKPSSSQLLWIIDIYGFMVAGFLVTMGTLGDRVGRRRLLLVGAAAFGAVSFVAAFSTSPEMLIASRAALGIAGATLAPSTLSLIFAMFHDPGQRSRAVAVWISAFSAGSAIGPIVGGLLLEHFWWGSVFLVSIPVMALLLILGPIVLPEYRDPNAGRLDLRSAVLSLIAVLAVIFAVKTVAQDGIEPIAFVSAVVGLGSGLLFVRRQVRLDDPMIDLRLFRIPTFRAALGINFLTIFVATGYFLFVAQYLQLVLGLQPFEAGLWSVPSAIGFIVGSNAAPRLVRYIRPAHLMGVSLTVAAVGLAILTQVGGPNGLAAVVVGSVVISLGLAPVFGLTTELVVGSAPPERAGAASGISETSFELGGALGIAILGSLGVAIYRGQIGAAMPTEVPVAAADAARDTLGAAIVVAQDLPSAIGATIVRAAQDAFVQGMEMAAVISAVVAVGVAVLAVYTLRDVEPSGSTEAEADDAATGNPIATKLPDLEPC
jgi:DHA2 family multidrug resistance protein-like MFS transporter